MPRKWRADDIGRFMVFIGPISSIFDIGTFALMWYVFGANTPAHQALFQSGWFVESLLTQTLIVHMIRTAKMPFIQSRAAWPVLLTTDDHGDRDHAAVLSLGRKLGLEPLPGSYFAWLAAILLLLRAHAGREGLVHPKVRHMALSRAARLPHPAPS